MKQSVDIFDSIPPGKLSLHVLMNLQDAYADARHGGPAMPEQWWAAYFFRTKNRVALLLEFAQKNSLPLCFPFVQEALADVDPELLRQCFDALLQERSLTESPVPEPAAPEERHVILMCGGPGSGKSSMIKKAEMPDDGILLMRDEIFPHLAPYPRLTKEAPNEATHVVVTEAILYNERDRYRYALLCQIPFIMVDGTLSYLDLGLEMIKIAQSKGYLVEVLHVDADIETATKRAEARSKESGVTINPKLLYESHVRCAANFFKYMEIADFSENWSNNGTFEQIYKFGVSYKMPLPDVQESTYRVATRLFKYPQIVKDGGTEQVDNHRLELIHLGDDVIVYMLRDTLAYNKLKEKAQLPLKDVSWPPNFDTVIAERLLYLDFLEQFRS